MKCPFKKKNVGLGAYNASEEFNDCDGHNCMAYDEETKICSLCSGKRIFNIDIRRLRNEF